MNGAAGSLAGGTLGSGLDSMSTGASAVSPGRLQQQLQSAMLQQAYLAQVQSALVQQQATAARKAEMKARQLANRRARREAELARRGGSLPATAVTNRENALAASFK
jgi:hypothetical protein